MSRQHPATERRKDYSLRAGVWRAIAGFIVWSSAFVVLYVGHALGCIYVPVPFQASSISVALSVFWLAHLLVCSMLVWRSRRQWLRVRHQQSSEHSGRFLWHTTLLIDVSALGAVLVIGLPLFAFPACS